MPPIDPVQLRQYLEFYQDLGFKTLYRRTASASVPAAEAVAPEAPVLMQTPPPVMELPPLAPSGDTLLQIIQDLGDCRRCKLHEARNKIVFGSGNEKSPLVFVGEGPGADEDEQGLPFVGRAGQLLTQMIEGTARKEGIALKRSDVYIANVVKCRPPDNRNPEPDEVAACEPFLKKQIELISPEIIVALGKFAVQTLLQSKMPITKLRGTWHTYEGIKLMPTFHPAYLLRNPADKKLVWEDIKKVIQEMRREDS